MNQLELIGQLFSPAAFIHDREEEILEMEKLIRDCHIGGITFFHSRHSAAANFEKRQEKLTYTNTLEKLCYLINRYQKASKAPLLISIDAEFGLAMRVENTPQYPYSITLGSLPVEKSNLVFDTAWRMGNDLKAAGIHLNFAPVADINNQPKNPVIGYRSFGADKEKVSQFAKAFYLGLRTAGVGACYKHFPGHGDTTVDSHLGMPIIEHSAEWLWENELYPFREGINAGIDMVMVAHLAVPAFTGGKNIPASISSEIIQGLLREKMGFKGIVVSDALNMKSVSAKFEEKGALELAAFKAGNDLLCFSEHVREGIQMIHQHADPSQIKESADRILAYKKKMKVGKAGPLATPEFDWPDHQLFNEELAINYVQVIEGEKPESFGKENLKLLSCFESGENVFANLLQEHGGAEIIDLENALALSDSDLIIAIFVPSAKPVNDFGLDKEVLRKVDLVAKKNNSVLYLFGNPISMRHIPFVKDMRQVVCAFQDFSVAQKKAAHLFLVDG